MTSILVEELKINIELNQVYFCSKFKIYCEPKKIFVIWFIQILNIWRDTAIYLSMASVVTRAWTLKMKRLFPFILNKYIFVRLATWIEKIILGPISATKYFLEVSALLDVKHLPSCNLVQYQRNIMMQFWENGKSPNLGPNLGVPKFFYGFYPY